MGRFQPEIFDYLKGVADKYGACVATSGSDSHVDRAHGTTTEMRWHVFTKDGRRIHRAVRGVRRRRPATSL